MVRGAHRIKKFLQSCRSKAGEYTLIRALQTYRYRVNLTNADGIEAKLQILVQSFRRTFIDRKTILFHPDGPLQFHALYKILQFLGYRVTYSTENKIDVAIRWWLAWDGNPFAPDKPFPHPKSTYQDGMKVLNMHCNDISKAKVNSVFEEVFGYSISIDPRTYNGRCVAKANWNALHKGRVMECPTDFQGEGVVYQKLIKNEVEDGLVEDMRVPVFGNNTPFVYLKYRSVGDRFVDRKHTNKKATIAEVFDVLSENELNNIHRFCERIGLDYGELDVLRDREDGRIYIVDANNTPSGPPSPINEEEAKVAVIRLAKAFEETFWKVRTS